MALASSEFGARLSNPGICAASARARSSARTVPDSYTDVARVWSQAEFNVVGNAGGSEAVFNTGTSIIVRAAVTDGSARPPTCVPNAGSTGESNNLNFVPSTSSPVCCPTAGLIRGSSSWRCMIQHTSHKYTASCGSSSITGGLVNACGGTGLLGGALGTPCGQSCSRLTCNGPKALTCRTFTNACGGCSSVPIAAGEGSTCSNGTQGRFYCTASKQLSCTCSKT
jgi:hypothetical protein